MAGALNALGLGFLFTAKDEVSEVIEHVHGGMENLEKASNKAHHSITDALGMSGKAIAGTILAVGAIAAGGAFEFAEQAEHFSSAIRQAGVASHATAEQMEELEQAAKRKGMDDLRGSAVGAADALRQLALEGMDAHEAGQALDGTIDLMRISMGALGARDAAGIVNDTLAQFRMNASQAGELSDKLAFAMKHFGFRAEELRGTMSGLASGAALTGASLDDTLITVGLVKSVFPSATKAAMATNAAMQQLASTHAQKELRGIGVAVADNTGKVRPLIDILDQLAKKTAHMTEAQVAHKLATIAGGKAAGGLTAIMDGLRKGVKDSEGHLLTGAAAVAYLRDQIANTQGTAKKMAAILGDDMGGALTALKAGLSNAAVAIGEPFEGVFKKVIQGLNLFVRGVTQLFTQGGFTGEVKEALDQHLGIKGFAIGVFMWIKRIQNFFGELADSFHAAFAPFAPLLDVLINQFGEIGRALGITGQTADENASAWDTFGEAGKGVGSILANLAGAVLPILITGIQFVVEAVQFMRMAWSALVPTLSNVWQTVSGVFGMIAGLLTGNWKKMWDGFVDTVVGAAQLVVKIISGALGIVAKLVDGVGSAFGKNFGLNEALQGATSFINQRVDSGTGVLKSAVGEPARPGVAAHIETARGIQGALAAGTPTEGGEQTVHHHVSVNVDGEKLAEAHARSKRSAAARSFHDVPAHEGSF